MDFEITHTPDIVGHQINITIKIDAPSVIASVETTLDGFHLATDMPAQNTTKFFRHFSQAGGYCPGNTHKLIVQAFDNNGTCDASTCI
jgi:hypothetical protein